MKPFEKTTINPNILDKLLGFAKPMLAYQDINNYLASVQRLEDIDKEKIKEIIEKHNLNNFQRFWLNRKLKNIIIAYIKHLLTNKNIENIITKVDNLQDLLGYDGDIFKDRGKQILKVIIQILIQDKKLDKEDIETIDHLAQRIGLSEKEVAEIYRNLAGSLIDQQLANAIADGDWSPEEEEQLLKLADNLGMKIVLSKDVQEKLDRLRFIWKVENDALDPIPVKLNLNKGEICVFANTGSLYAWHRRSRNVSVSGPTLSFRIIKGFYLSHGSYSVKRETVEELEKKDTGEIYLTNKRFIFKGEKQVVSLPYHKILDVSVEGNYIYLYKQTGKPIIITITNKPEDFLLIITHYIYK